MDNRGHPRTQTDLIQIYHNQFIRRRIVCAEG
jgi:hypothetical protein